MSKLQRVNHSGLALGAVITAFLLSECGGDSNSDNNVGSGLGESNGPVSIEAPVIPAVGDPALGNQVIRFETFGNEGFLMVSISSE